MVVLSNRGEMTMQGPEDLSATLARRLAWNKGKLIGAKPPLRPKHVWAIRTKLQVEGRIRELATFNLAIDSKLRGCDVVALKVEDVAPNGYAVDRATVRQKKTGQPVWFELTEQTRQATDDYLKETGMKTGDFLFPSRRNGGRCITTRHYARLVLDWIASIGLDANRFGAHSLRRTKATLIYRRTGRNNGMDDRDNRASSGRLGAGDARPSRCATEQRNELAPLRLLPSVRGSHRSESSRHSWDTRSLINTARYTRVAAGMVAKIESPSPCCHSRRRSPEKPGGAVNNSYRPNRSRLCPVQRWRSRISSAATVRHGVLPMSTTSASIS
jgi:integrase